MAPRFFPLKGRGKTGASGWTLLRKNIQVTRGHSHSKGWGIHVGGKNPGWPNAVRMGSGIINAFYADNFTRPIIR